MEARATTEGLQTHLHPRAAADTNVAGSDMRLSTFITEQKRPILQKWEDFARTILPAASSMDVEALRDHASLILDTIAADLQTAQSPEEQQRKSVGTGKREDRESYAEVHATDRQRVGYNINQLVSEYRALRASVLKLWTEHCGTLQLTDLQDLTRFNEAIDQALAESVARFSSIVAKGEENEKRRLDAILDTAPVGICVVDSKGGLVLANAENRSIWGEHPQPSDVDSYEHWKGWWADGSERQGQRLSAREWTVARALAGEAAPTDTIEIEPFGAHGVRKTILMRSRPIRDSAGTIIGSVVAETDITLQVKTEAALRESEAKFRTIADAMPQMVWSTRPDGYHDYYNQQWYDFTGELPHATDGDGWNQKFHPEDQERAWAAWRHSLATGDDYEVQYRLRHHSGQYRWTLGRALPVRDDHGRIIRWMGTCTDIHDQKLAEADLKRQSERKDEFLAMLAHELRNPLAPISTAAQLLKLGSTDAKRVQHASDVVARQVKHMTDLVDDLLDVSRVTRGLVQIENDSVDLKAVVSHAIEQVRPLIESRHHELRVHMAPRPAFVRGDRTRLVQVVANIINNAAKYTPQGGHIMVELNVDQDDVSIHVTDDGSGISPSLLPGVFDLFSQGERTPDRSQGGLGLGLSLVKQITALHGGDTTAASAGLGKGSKFTVTLPREQKPVEDFGEQRRTGTSAEMGSSNVMIVDDNIDAARSLADLLNEGGHNTIVVEDAQSVLDYPDKDHIQVFILDIGLPGMDGYELARRLRSDPATEGATIVALTGYGQAHDRILSKAAGFDHHLVKPADMMQLNAVLARIPPPRSSPPAGARPGSPP